MTSCDDASSYCVMANTLGRTINLFICIGRIGYIEVDASLFMLTLAPTSLPIPLPNTEVLPPLSYVL